MTDQLVTNVRPIDANKLKDVVEYQCLTNDSKEAEKWNEWFQRVINAQPTIEVK